MPELPEVETTLRGIQPHIQNQFIHQVIIRHHSLRWPIPANISQKLQNQQILKLDRRGKYLLFTFKHGTTLIHLGMSGSLRILKQATPAQKHDHFDLIFDNEIILRFTDPRRFGAFLWVEGNPSQHKLLKNLGPEPLTTAFSNQYLWQAAQKRKVPIKTFIMDSKIVVGVGNIYANEALFMAKIHPQMPANRLSMSQAMQLAKAIKQILKAAIKRGGTTLKDFLDSEGKPGYFSQQLKVYGREGLPCVQCKTTLQLIRLGQRSTVFCMQCQTYNEYAPQKTT